MRKGLYFVSMFIHFLSIPIISGTDGSKKFPFYRGKRTFGKWIRDEG